MTEHDLSALDGLLDELDIEEKGTEDPRAAKLQALFERAKAEYTARIDNPAGFVPTSSSSTAPFDIANFRVPCPTELLAERKADRTGATSQEWTANYLYVQGHFELCLAYVVSFAMSMNIPFPSTSADMEEVDTSQMALRRSKQERELSKNWSVVKDVVDVGMRALLTLLRSSQAECPTIAGWGLTQQTEKAYEWTRLELRALARGFLVFAMREVRVGAGDTRSGFSGMVIAAPEGGRKSVDMDKVGQQNWTVTHGLALTAGDVALELGLWRTAIEAHTLFLACRGQLWRVLLALAHELTALSHTLAPASSSSKTIVALQVVAKTAVVSALQAIPRPRRLELAMLILDQHRVIPRAWIDDALDAASLPSSEFANEDELLFQGLLAEREEEPTVVPEEVAIALVKVVFAKKSGLLAVYEKFPTYMREYRQRLDNAASSTNASNDWAADIDIADDEDASAGPRSVRTL